MIYCGVGSRETPDVVAPHAVLRSGGAEGADTAFEFGATLGQGRKEIYLPWKNFNGRINGELLEPSLESYDLAKTFHPRFSYLSQGSKKLIARDGHQVMGKDLMTPCDMVICWTKDGKATGGTGQAIRIADAYDIPVYNLHGPEALSWILEVIDNDGIPLDKRETTEL